MGVWYVSAAVATNGNGTSWATAWKDLNNIVWSSISAGDTINVDGGTSSLTYTHTLTIGKSGTSGNPIIIQASTEAGHIGTINHTGGRTTPLPYSGQAAASWTETATVSTEMIIVGNHSFITIDGSRWNGWHISGNAYDGVSMGTSASNVLLRHLEINDCGIGVLDTGTNTWLTDLAGIRPQGSNHTVEYCNLHDNGQDCMQTGNTNANFTVNKTWMHFLREHPVYTGNAYNVQRFDTGVGTHQDGLQMYGTTATSNITFTDCLFGPGLMNGLIISNPLTTLSMSQCLIFPVADHNLGNGIINDGAATDASWSVNHVTCFHYRSAGTTSFYFDKGNTHSITNTIIRSIGLNLANALVSNAGNIQFDIEPLGSSSTFFGGTTVDPNFVTNVGAWGSVQPSFSQLYSANLSPQASSAIGKGVTDFSSVDTILMFVGAGISATDTLTVSDVAKSLYRWPVDSSTSISESLLATDSAAYPADIMVINDRFDPIADNLMAFEDDLILTSRAASTGEQIPVEAMSLLDSSLVTDGFTGARESLVIGDSLSSLANYNLMTFEDDLSIVDHAFYAGEQGPTENLSLIPAPVFTQSGSLEDDLTAHDMTSSLYRWPVDSSASVSESVFYAGEQTPVEAPPFGETLLATDSITWPADVFIVSDSLNLATNYNLMIFENDLSIAESVFYAGVHVPTESMSMGESVLYSQRTSWADRLSVSDRLDTLIRIISVLFPTAKRRAGFVATAKRRAGTIPTTKRRAGFVATAKRRAGTIPTTKRRAGFVATAKRRAGTMPIVKRRAGTMRIAKRRAGTMPAPSRRQ